jgi:hypothetical protein
MPKKMRFTRRETNQFNSFWRLKFLRREPGQCRVLGRKISDGYPSLTGFRPITAIAVWVFEGLGNSVTGTRTAGATNLCSGGRPTNTKFLHPIDQPDR